MSRIVGIALVIVVLLSGAAVGSAQTPTREFNVPVQAATTGIPEFARQAGIQILVAEALVHGKQTSAVVGTYTVEQGLNRLLESTALIAVAQDDKTLTLLKRDGTSVATPPNTTGEAGKNSSQDFHVAQVDQGTPASSTSVEGFRQSSDQDRVRLEEVVVTAQKREESILDVPISIIAMSAKELQQRQITTLEDLPYAVPDLAYVKTGNAYNFEIRGISNNAGTAPLVGMYVDEADVTLGGLSNAQVVPVTYDLERVEVLRGPQGTLYGEGSAGGTIRFITKTPDLTKFAFDSQVTAMFTEGGDPSQRINAMVNIPLIGDQLGLRIANTYEHRGGWIDQPDANQKHINGEDLTNVRVKGLWKPDRNLNVSAMAIINRDERGVDFSDLTSPSSWTQVFNLPSIPRIRNDYDLYNLTATYDVLSVARILNTVTYLKEFPVSWNSGLTIPTGPPGEGDPVFNFYQPFSKTVDHLLTEELRVASLGSERWQWTVGGFYRHYRERQIVPANYYDLPGPPNTPLSNYFSYPSSVETLYQSWSAFGDVSYKFWNWFTFGVGVRHFREHQDFTDHVLLTHQAALFHSLDPRVYAQFKIAPNVNVYLSAAKGFRSGGFNGFGQPPFDPEGVWAYELGTKMTAFEGRVGFETAVFLSNYGDYQTFGLDPATGVAYYSNAGRARIKGVEVNSTWRISSQWRLEARGDYLNARFTELNAAQTAHAPGDPIDFVPRYQFTVSGQHDFSLMGRQGFIRLDYSQQGPETYRNRYFLGGPSPWYYAESDVVQLLNLRASLQLNGNLRLGAFLQNMLNDQGFVSPLYIGGNGVRSRPRTFGVDFGAAF